MSHACLRRERRRVGDDLGALLAREESDFGEAQVVAGQHPDW